MIKSLHNADWSGRGRGGRGWGVLFSNHGHRRLREMEFGMMFSFRVSTHY